MASGGITAMQIFHRIWIANKNFLVERTPAYVFTMVRIYSENARVGAKLQWNARECVTGLHDRRSRFQ